MTDIISRPMAWCAGSWDPGASVAAMAEATGGAGTRRGVLTSAAGLVAAGPRTAVWAASRASRRRVARPAGRPAPVPTLRLTGNVACDELVLGAMVGSQPPPDPDQLAAAGAEMAAAAAQHHDRGWSDDPGRYHRSPPPLGDTAVAIRSRRWLSQRYEHVTFDSGFRPRPDEPGADRWDALVGNARAHVAVLRHPGPARPWLVCIHGFGTGTPRADFLAFHVSRLHRQLGLNLALPVLPLHGPRRDPGSPMMLSYDLALSIHGLAQAAWDVRRVIGWIRSQSDAPVGLYGVSLGAYTAALVAGLEPTEAVIAGVPAVDIPDLFARHAPRALARSARNAGLLGPAADAAFRVVSPLALPPQVPHQARAIYAGLGDRFVPTHQPVSLWDHWDRPELRWYPGGHVGFIWSKPVEALVARRATLPAGDTRGV
jgi:hypothetical protein